jgi:molecular chaperone GrpE
MIRLAARNTSVRGWICPRALSRCMHFSRVHLNGDGECKDTPPKAEQSHEVELSKLQEEHRKLQSTFSEREEKIKDLQNAYLQTLADMENLRTRTKKEIENASLFSIQKFSKDLIGVSDILEMAVASVPESQLKHLEAHSLRDLHNGVAMTLDGLIKCFKRHGIEPLNPQHEKFDPNVHSALVEVPTAEHPPGTIVFVEKKGYSLNGRILRAPIVAIAKPLTEGNQQ